MPPKNRRALKSEAPQNLLTDLKRVVFKLDLTIIASDYCTVNIEYPSISKDGPKYPQYYADYIDCYINDSLIWDGKPSKKNEQSPFLEKGVTIKSWYEEEVRYQFEVPFDVEKTMGGFKIKNSTTPPLQLKVILYYGGHEIESITKTIPTTFIKKVSKTEAYCEVPTSFNTECMKISISSTGLRKMKNLEKEFV